jgi:hypothetical protein
MLVHGKCHGSVADRAPGGNAALSAEQPSKTAFHTYLNEKTTEL